MCLWCEKRLSCILSCDDCADKEGWPFPGRNKNKRTLFHLPALDDQLLYRPFFADRADWNIGSISDIIDKPKRTRSHLPALDDQLSYRLFFTDRADWNIGNTSDIIDKQKKTPALHSQLLYWPSTIVPTRRRFQPRLTKRKLFHLLSLRAKFLSSTLIWPSCQPESRLRF